MENKKFAGYKAALGAFLVIFVNIGVCAPLWACSSHSLRPTLAGR